MPKYQDVYRRIVDSSSLENYLKTDQETNISYIEDFRCVEKHNPNVIREANLKFLKILNTCGFLTKQSLAKEDIKTIINVIEAHYRNGSFIDSDLHDDVFEHFDIVFPITAYDSTLRNDFIQKNLHHFADHKECTDFLANRSKLFCLYIFLRRCAILFRDTPYKRPLELLLEFLSNKENYSEFKANFLRVKSTIFSGEYWGSGLHEWLTCQSTVIALRRSAGLPDIAGNTELKAESHIKPVEGRLSFKGEPEQIFIFSEFNWLDFQFLVRTATKHIIFSHNLNGHPGAVYGLIVPAKSGKTKGMGPKTEWDNKFHTLINERFYQCKEIGSYMFEIASLYEQVVLHERTASFNLTATPYFLVNGTRTDNAEQMQSFQRQVLKEPHENMHIWYRDMLIQIDLNRLAHGDRITYTYDPDCVIPIFRNIENANSGLAFAFAPQ